MKKMFLLCFFLASSLTGCLYRMPSDNSISTLPNMNNPHVTREPATSFIPK